MAGLTYLVVAGLLLQGLVNVMNSTYSLRDTKTAAGVQQPTTSLRSGGAGSLMPSDTLGWQGRNFTGKGPTAGDIGAFTGHPAMEPIRIYAGLASAPDAESRAALAVRDLQRAGGFGRKNLLVVTTTGSGWVDPGLSDSFEYLSGGDCGHRGDPVLLPALVDLLPGGPVQGPRRRHSSRLLPACSLTAPGLPPRLPTVISGWPPATSLPPAAPAKGGSHVGAEEDGPGPAARGERAGGPAQPRLPGREPSRTPQSHPPVRGDKPAIEQVSNQVFNAVGFDVANATFVIGQDGAVVIDAMLAVENMAAALLAFREICEYPITGLVYTHSHGDHWGGSPALVTPEQAASGEVPVIAQRQLMAEIARINGYNQPIMGARATYQFGQYLTAPRRAGSTWAPDPSSTRPRPWAWCRRTRC